MPLHTTEYLQGLVNELRQQPEEVGWIEFKQNNTSPQEIGEYISALSNAAAVNGKSHGYLIWGIRDSDHSIVGTRFSPQTSKKGNEPLENWLLRLLNPKIQFSFLEVAVEEQPVVLLQIAHASQQPVRFSGTEYIRVGSVKQPLKNAPELERELWRIFDRTPFEDLNAREHQSAAAVLSLLDYTSYFDLLGQPLPSSRDAILAALKREDLIDACDAGGWNIKNLGALLFAKDLKDFRNLKRKAIRVIQYRGTGRIDTAQEEIFSAGYAAGFVDLIEYIRRLVPVNEVIEQALRKAVPMFPMLALRELVANALIHQDLFATGTGPLVEIFDDRIEITNPGEPLVDTQRFIDSPPKSRNETMASLLRRLGICEERGSGIDKVVSQVEFYQLPAPLFEVPGEFTRSVVFAHQQVKDMDKADRIRACYLHACLKHVSRDFLTNPSLRDRFGIAEKNKAMVSRYIKEAIEADVIKPYDRNAARRMMKYLPFWA